jgi:uncharacterized phiE125 gp8 family phage protein
MKIITAASAVITTAELKSFLRVDSSSEDSLIDGFLLAAMAYAQHYTGLAIGSQTIELALDAFPDGGISLPLIPATSITSVIYVDAAGTSQTLLSSLYYLNDYSSQDHQVTLVYGAEWPDTRDTTNAVKVRYVAGSATLPASVKAALMLLVGHLYENRQEATEKALHSLPLGIKALLDTVKVWSA